MPGNRNHPPRTASVPDELNDTIGPMATHQPLPIAPLIQAGRGLTVRRSMMTVVDDLPSPSSGVAQRQVARLLEGIGPSSLAPINAPTPPNRESPTSDDPPVGDLRARLMAATQTGPEPFAFVRYRRRAVAPAPAAPSLVPRPTTEMDPLAPTAAREMVVAADPSTPLRDDQRAAIEPLVGGNLGDVRVHTGARAMATAARLRAEAFTVGKDIFFRQGGFEPSTERGQALLAHELVHVRQESEATSGAPGPRGDQEATEAEAEATERLVFAHQQPDLTGQLTVGKLVRNYATSSGRPIDRQERERLDAISLQAVAVCERLLGPMVSRIDEHEIGLVSHQLSLELSRLSDDQAAEIWGRALADAVRQRIRL